MCVGIVRETGSIVKCFDEMFGEFLVSDELRKVLCVNYNFEQSSPQRTTIPLLPLANSIKC